MRRYLGSLALVASAAALVPVAAAPADSERSFADANTAAVQQSSVSAQGLRDEGAMVLVGTALIGLAAAVRRAA
jgi:hypothetical protein